MNSCKKKGKRAITFYCNMCNLTISNSSRFYHFNSLKHKSNIYLNNIKISIKLTMNHNKINGIYFRPFDQ